jgi:hypothetical protein
MATMDLEEVITCLQDREKCEEFILQMQIQIPMPF